MAAIRLLIVALVVWAVRRTILGGLTDLSKQPWHLEPLWLAVAGATYLVSLLPAGLFWHRVLLAMGQDAQLGETLRAYYVGHLGKYVPGKALVVVLRAGLVRSHRVDTVVAAVSVFFETLTMMSVGAFISAAILAVWFRNQRFLFLVAVGLMLVAGLPTFPPIFKWLVRLTGVAGAGASRADSVAGLGYGTLLLGWTAMALGWATMGVSLWGVLRAMGLNDVPLLAQLPLYTVSVSLAMVAGFLSLVPGGALVREAILAELISPHFGDAVALVSAVVLRLVWLVSEVLISGILYLIGPRPSKVPPPDALPDLAGGNR